MIGQPPPSPPGATRKRDLVELRVANLRRELEAETDPTAEAAILYEVGILCEHALDQPEEASKQYDRAATMDPLFQPALMARLRIAERQPNGHSVSALCEAQVAGAHQGSLRAAALVDFALNTEEWASLLREAIEESSEPAVAALILEWLAEARGDQTSLREALRAQAQHASDRDLRGALWLDLALAELDAGEVDASLETLERACESDALSWQARTLSIRVAREHRRWNVFDHAAAALAEQLERAAASEDPIDPLNLPVPRPRRLPTAALVWQEAAERRLESQNDPEGAAALLESALRIRPEDPGLRLRALTMAEQMGSEDRVQAASEWFHASAPNYPGFVAHGIRRALSDDDPGNAIETLRAAAERYPGSTYARAALDVTLIRTDAHEARADVLCRLGEGQEGQDRARAFWHAAQLTTHDPSGAEHAQALYSEAASVATEAGDAIVREAMGAALLSGRFDLLPDWCDALLSRGASPDERALVAFSKYDILRRALEAEDEARTFLQEAVDDPAHQSWAPHVARARAAWSGDSDLLIRAHETLASLTVNDVRVGHLCAAAQTYARAGRWESSEDALRRALEEAPDDGHVLSLLQGVLRESGRPEAAVSLAHQRSESDPGSPLDELSLLLAGATAERNENFTAARHAYEVALKAFPSSPSAALALLDIARRQGDAGATIRAHSALAQSDLGGGVPEVYSVLLGDALAFAGRESEAAEAYETALDDPATSIAAAIGLLSVLGRLTTDPQRGVAERVLERSAAATEDPSGGFAEAYGAWRADLERSVPTGDAWLRLSELAPNEHLRAGALLQGLRATRIARGADAGDELFLLAQDAIELATDELEATAAIDEALSAGDDADFRASSLEHRLHHSDAMGRAALESAYCRALVDADRGAEAVAILSREIDERPDDLALWETLRSAARRAEDWSLVALACERLAQFVDGSLRADLLEEAGVVRLDHLDQDQLAEDSFRAALAEDPGRDVAFRRLHDLLAEKEDADALQDLVASRLEQGGPQDREELLYERARLLRGFSERTEALQVLDELFVATPDHPGALALAAEVHVSLEHWDEAVESLQRLAGAKIPPEQKGIAHLGAADFLESRLGRSEEALAELRAVDDLGLADASTLTRIGKLESIRGHDDRAVDAYQRALGLEPTLRIAISSLVELLEDAPRTSAIKDYERAIWESIDRGELEVSLLQGLEDAATWRSQPERATAVKTSLVALQLVAADQVTHGSRPTFDHVPLGALGDVRADETFEHVVLRAGPSLVKGRLPSRQKAGPEDRVYGQLDLLCRRFGAPLGTIALSDAPTPVQARAGRHGEVDWLVSPQNKDALGHADVFHAGRLAWAVPRGAGELVGNSTDDIAAKLAGILRAGRCEVEFDSSAVARIEVKLPRSVRRTVHELVSGTRVTTTALLQVARRLQQGADRAGLMASGDIGVALGEVLPSRKANLEGLRTSERALDLLRFWIGAESPLWGAHG